MTEQTRPTDHPATEPRTGAAFRRCRSAFYRRFASWDGECEHGFGPPATLCTNAQCDDKEFQAAFDALGLAIEAEAAQGAAPRPDGTDAGALANILDEAKGGGWKPDDGTSLWFVNEAGDQLHLTGDDVALLLNAALSGAAPRAEGLPTDAQAEAWLKANDLIAVTHFHESPYCAECQASRPSDERATESEASHE